MEIRSGFDGLSSLLGVNTTDTVAGRGKSHAAGAGGIGSEDHATLSSAASQMAQTSGEDGVRTE